jgi:hypothetical protein
MPANYYDHPSVYIRSVAATDFTAVCANNGLITANIPFPANIKNTREILIEGIIIQAKENLIWDCFIFTSSNFNNANLDLDNYLDWVNFPLANGKQIAGAGQFYYSAMNLSTRYQDLDRAVVSPTTDPAVHVGLVCRSAAGKTAGANGQLAVTIIASPILGV